MHNVFCFIFFCRITYDPFCSVEINTFYKYFTDLVSRLYEGALL